MDDYVFTNDLTFERHDGEWFGTMNGNDSNSAPTYQEIGRVPLGLVNDAPSSAPTYEEIGHVPLEYMSEADFNFAPVIDNGRAFPEYMRENIPNAAPEYRDGQASPDNQRMKTNDRSKEVLDPASIGLFDDENEISSNAPVIKRRKKKEGFLPCAVCGGNGRRKVGEKRSCGPCFAFFLLWDNRPIEECSKQCTITHSSEAKCQWCRFQKCLEVGMKTDKSEQAPCVICELPNQTVRRGVNLCGTCKIFSRTWKNGKTPAKKCSNKCTISHKLRMNCSYCRFQKCVKAGLYNFGKYKITRASDATLDQQPMDVDECSQQASETASINADNDENGTPRNVPIAGMCVVCDVEVQSFKFHHCGVRACEDCHMLYRKCGYKLKRGIKPCPKNCDIASELCHRCRLVKCASVGMGQKQNPLPAPDMLSSVGVLPDDEHEDFIQSFIGGMDAEVTEPCEKCGEELFGKNCMKCMEIAECSVCRATPANFHFGATTCKNCGEFFRSHIAGLKKNGIKSCTKGQNCDMKKPGDCSDCRMKKCREVGMQANLVRSARNRIQKRMASSTQNNGKKCAVCGDFPASNHYGAISCGRCRFFFKQRIRENVAVHHCAKSKNCEITPVSQDCAYCRLQKCYEVGMKSSKVRKEVNYSHNQNTLAENINPMSLDNGQGPASPSTSAPFLGQTSNHTCLVCNRQNVAENRAYHQLKICVPCEKFYSRFTRKPEGKRNSYECECKVSGFLKCTSCRVAKFKKLGFKCFSEKIRKIRKNETPLTVKK